MLKKKNENDTEQPVEIYKQNKSFQEIIRRRYNINDIGLLYDDRILLLIYTYEWFQIPAANLYDKVCYHPLVVRKDHIKLSEIYENEKNIFLATMLPFFGLLYFIKSKFSKGRNLRKNFKLLALISTSAVVVPSVLWKLYFVSRMNRNIFNDTSLNKYLKLNVDKEKIKQDLLNYNIVLP
jgi:hypothetical protein